jgi:hypothetical protein
LLATVPLPNITNATYLWIQLQTLDDQVTANVFTVDPHDVPGVVPAFTVAANLVGRNADLLGYGVAGYAGLVCTSTTTWQFLDWRAEGIWPCDFQFNARAIAAPSFSEQAQKDTDKFRKDFQFAVRASDPRMLSATSLQARVPLQTSQTFALGRSYARRYKETYNVPVSEPSGMLLTQSANAANSKSIFNRGNWIAKPVITIYGGISNPVITNVTTGVQLVLTGTVATNDFIVVDCNQHLVTNSAGVNVFGFYSTQNQGWLTLVPGANLLTLVGTSLAGSPYAVLSYQYAWSV